jgi:hypothetical protein
MNDPIWWSILKSKVKWWDNHSGTLEYIQLMNSNEKIINLSSTSEYICNECALKINAFKIYDHINIHK